MLLYDALRPVIISLHDIDELCELVDILKHEVGGARAALRAGRPCAHVPWLSSRQVWAHSIISRTPAGPSHIDYMA